jgi:hypothetical protein
MRRPSPAPGLAALVGAALSARATAAGGPATTVLRLNAIGPLHRGMARTSAVAILAIPTLSACE